LQSPIVYIQSPDHNKNGGQWTVNKFKRHGSKYLTKCCVFTQKQWNKFHFKLPPRSECCMLSSG
jgi:hypothetical protein